MTDFTTYIRSDCYGVANAKKSSELEKQFNCKGTEIRSRVNELRCSGIPVCSGSKGYYYGIDENDIRRTIVNLKSRIKKIQSAIDGLQSLLLTADKERV